MREASSHAVAREPTRTRHRRPRRATCGSASGGFCAGLSSAWPRSLLPAASRSVPTTIAPAIRLPQPIKKPARPRSSFLRPILPVAAGSQPTLPTACCAANGGRSTRIRNSISLKSASQPTTRACARRWRPIWPRATRSAAARAGLFPNALRQHQRQPRPRLRKSALGERHDQLQRPRDRRPGKLGAGLLGPHSPHRRGRPRKRAGQRRRHGQRRS